MKKNMLVVVDYQNDFVNGALGFEGAEKLDVIIADLIEEYINRGDMVVVTKDTHSEKYLETKEGKNLPVTHCVKGTEGFELFGKTAEKALKYADEIYFIEKPSFGVHPSEMLKLSEVVIPQNIEFVGLVSNICVLSNVCCFGATFPEANMSVRKNAVASFDNESNQKTLDLMSGIQVSVIE